MGGGLPEDNAKKEEEEFKDRPPTTVRKFDDLIKFIGSLSPDELQNQLTDSAQMAMGFKTLDIECNLGRENGRAEELDLTLGELAEKMDELGMEDCKHAKSFTVKPRLLKRIWNNH